MAKVDLDLVKNVITQQLADPQTAHAILNRIQEELKAEEAEKEEKPPREKKQFVILVSDPNMVLDAQDITGWVIQIPESDSPHTAEERITRAAYEFNQSKKGRRYPVKTIGEACEVVGAKYHKAQNVAVKTKEPVLVVRTSNVIPWNDRKADD